MLHRSIDRLQGDGYAMIQLYSTTNCPNCRVLKQFLENKNIQYKEVDMATPAALTELRMNGVFTMSAPVLQVGSRFFTTKELFSQERVDQSKLESIFKS